MPEDRVSVALAARAHTRASARSDRTAAASALRAAAAAVGTAVPGALSGPSIVTTEGALLLSVTDPVHVLPVTLHVAEALRPRRTTFCAAVVARDGARAAAAADVESALLSAEAASSLALEGLEETDPREQRFILLAPGEDRVLGALVGLLLAAYDGMTERQRQMISLIRSSDTQQQVARHLSVSRQAVNQSLAAAGWPHLRRAEEAVLIRFAAMSPSPPGATRAAARKRSP